MGCIGCDEAVGWVGDVAGALLPEGAVLPVGVVLSVGAVLSAGAVLPVGAAPGTTGAVWACLDSPEPVARVVARTAPVAPTATAEPDAIETASVVASAVNIRRTCPGATRPQLRSAYVLSDR